MFTSWMGVLMKSKSNQSMQKYLISKFFKVNMKTKIILIRHAETGSNSRNELDGQMETIVTEKGKEQAKALAKYLKNEKIDVAYSSPHKRAIFTGETVIQDYKNLRLIKIAEFKEMDCGICTGINRNEVIEKYPELHKGWMDLTDPPFPKGECLEDVEKRVIPTFNRIVKENEGKVILISGHGSLNIAIIGHFLKIPYGLRFKIKQSNCCINEMIFRNNDFLITKINFQLNELF